MGKYAKRQVIGAGSIPPLPDFHRARDDAGQQEESVFSLPPTRTCFRWGTITKEKSLYDWSKTNFFFKLEPVPEKQSEKDYAMKALMEKVRLKPGPLVFEEVVVESKTKGPAPESHFQSTCPFLFLLQIFFFIFFYTTLAGWDVHT